MVSIFFITTGACEELAELKETETVLQAAVISENQLDEAFEIIRRMADIEYIPFVHKKNGCSARALYMAAELAAKGIPSSSFYLFGELYPTEDLVWKVGHVAPLIKLAGDHQPYILDPSLANEPKTVREWIALNNPKNGKYGYWLSQGSYYAATTSSTVPTLFAMVMLGAHFGLLPDLEKRPIQDEHLIDSFDELSKFRRSDILGACEWMYDNWEEASKKDENIDLENRRRLLVSRTQDLLYRLEAKDKLDQAPLPVFGRCRIQ